MKLYTWLYKYIRQSGAKMPLILLCSLSFACCTLAIPFFIGKAIGATDGEAVDFRALGQNVLILGAIYCLLATSHYLLALSANRAGKRLVSVLRREALLKVNRLSVKTLDSTSQGELVSRLTSDADAVGEGLGFVLLQLFSGIVIILGCAAMMIYLNYTIALFTIVAVPLAVLVTSTVSRIAARRYFAAQKAIAEYNSYLSETITNFGTIKSFAYQEQAYKKAHSLNKRLGEVYKNAMYIAATSNPLARTVANIVYVLTGLAGGLIACGGGPIGAGLISSLLSYSLAFSRPITEISSIAPQVAAAKAGARRLKEFFGEPEELEQGNKTLEAPICGEIEFKNVCFGYSKNVPLFKGLSFKIEAGQTVAIVGPTGAGKSSIVNLLMRFYDAESGTILVDGQDISELKRSESRKIFSMVLQDVWLFEGSVRDNIAFGNKNATQDDIINAAKSAFAHDFIMRLPQKYGTIINENRSGISLGESQLLTIARAMLENAPILILDEATSSVDSRTEKLISLATKNLISGKTCIVIAHRLSTVRSADKILVVNNGEIIESGNHEQLIEARGMYYNMINETADAPAWDG